MHKSAIMEKTVATSSPIKNRANEATQNRYQTKASYSFFFCVRICLKLLLKGLSRS